MRLIRNELGLSKYIVARVTTVECRFLVLESFDEGSMLLSNDSESDA
jgi:hypothetical protein